MAYIPKLPSTFGGPGYVPTIIEILGKSDVGAAGIWDVFQENAAPRIVTERDLDRQGNIVAFGPVAQEYSQFEALLIVVAFAKFMKTSEGQKHIKDITVKYLDSMAKVIGTMQKAASSNVLTALLNQYACTNIYARMGLITPYDQLQTKVFLDHYFGELLKLSYVGDMVQGLTTLVDATSTTEKVGEEDITTKTAGLATLAKIFSK